LGAQVAPSGATLRDRPGTALSPSTAAELRR